MSHSSRIFDRVPIDLPNRSGFDLSHENLFTATCGTLVPCLCHPMLPNDTISLGTNFQVQLPPMVTDFYGKVDAVVEVFFVPNRLLWGGWEDFITHPTKNPQYPDGTPVQGRPSRVPTLNLIGVDVDNFSSGSLADYLGMKSVSVSAWNTDYLISAMPFIAYHRIWDDWYRDTRIQSPLFYRPSSNNPYTSTDGVSIMSGPYSLAACAPYVSVVGPGANQTPNVSDSTQLYGPMYLKQSAGGKTFDSTLLGDGVSLWSLRQRNWSKGYFTTATTLPQAGDGAEIQIDVDDNGTGAISIAAIRSANSLQKWEERNNFSYRYADQIYGQFGIYPDSAKMDRAIYLGRTRQTVYTRSVFQTADGEGGINDVVGSKKGSAQVLAEDSLVGSFRASEHGYLMALFSLVPHSYYSTGASREFSRLESEDFPFPLLAGMGDQKIMRSELVGLIPNQAASDAVFGYNDLYSEYKYIEDEVHGLLRDGQSLENFALQRSFEGSGVELSSEFLQIPINALDQVQAVSTSEQGFSCWVDMYFTMKKISTLPAYSLPTLADMKNVHTGHVSRGGTRL